MIALLARLPRSGAAFLTLLFCVGSVARAATTSLPVIRTFTTVGRATVQRGQSVRLRWTVKRARRLSIAPKIGVVVTPHRTTTYVLTARNFAGRVRRRKTVIVAAPPNAAVRHPRIWITPADVAGLNQRAAASDPAWIKLRAACDAYVAMSIQFPDGTPSGDTINGGYQYNDYLLPSEQLALGYLATKTSDPVRAAKYAAKERQLLLVLSDPVHHGVPTTDSGYSIRSYVPALAIGYDWIFEKLNDVDRFQIYTEINRWVASYEATGFGRNFPQGNYFAGYYCAKALGALASEGENPRAAAMWNDWLNRVHFGMVQPYYSRWLSGGGAPDGWNYGPFEAINMLRPIAAARTAKGIDLIHDVKPLAYFDGHARWMTQFTWPGMESVSDRGFVYDGDNPTPAGADWATQYGGLLRLAGGDNAPIMQRYTLDLRDLQGTNDVEPWAEFLLHQASAPATDYHTALSLMTSGDGQVAMRSSWDVDAVWGAFQAGPYTGFPDSSEEFFDEGSLAIQRGSVAFLVNGWGALMRNTPGTNDGSAGGLFSLAYNELFNDQTDGVHDGRRIFNTFYAARSGGLWGQLGNGPDESDTTLSRFEDGGDYVLMRGTGLASQYASKHPITAWTRTIVYVRPQIFVVYDRTVVASAATDNWMAWHVAAAPVERAGAMPGTHRFDVVDARAAFGGNLFRGRVTTVLPAGNVVTTVDVFNRAKVYRLEVRPPSPAAATRWLAVFDASASAAAAAGVAPLTEASGNVSTGSVEGALILGADGRNTAVLFGLSEGAVSGSITVQLPAADTQLVIADLVPSSGYAVTASAAGGKLTVEVTPGNGFPTTAAGTVVFRVSASGAVSAP